MNFAHALGKIIRAARYGQGLSQEVLAARLGRTRGWVAHVEAGRVHVETEDVVELARALGVTPEKESQGPVLRSPDGEPSEARPAGRD